MKLQNKTVFVFSKNQKFFDATIPTLETAQGDIHQFDDLKEMLLKFQEKIPHLFVIDLNIKKKLKDNLRFFELLKVHKMFKLIPVIFYGEEKLFLEIRKEENASLILMKEMTSNSLFRSIKKSMHFKRNVDFYYTENKPEAVLSLSGSLLRINENAVELEAPIKLMSGRINIDSKFFKDKGINIQGFKIGPHLGKEKENYRTRVSMTGLDNKTIKIIKEIKN
jgi:hypothetical protein